MTIGAALAYGTKAAAAAGVTTGSGQFYVDAAQLVVDMLTSGKAADPGSMSSVAAPTNPVPVTGSGKVVPTLSARAWGDIAAARSGCPLVSSQVGFYTQLAQLVFDVGASATIAGSGFQATPAGALTGASTIVVPSLAIVYATASAARIPVPPPAPSFYRVVAQLVLDVMADAVVTPVGLIGNPGGGPVTGAGTIT